MGPLQAQAIEDVDDAACAVIERKGAVSFWLSPLAPVTSTRITGDRAPEVIGRADHMSPVISRLRPEHHRLAAAADLHPHRSEDGVPGGVVRPRPTPALRTAALATRCAARPSANRAE